MEDPEKHLQATTRSDQKTHFKERKGTSLSGAFPWKLPLPKGEGLGLSSSPVSKA